MGRWARGQEAKPTKRPHAGEISEPESRYLVRTSVVLTGMGRPKNEATEDRDGVNEAQISSPQMTQMTQIGRDS
jgi:hypothetical protein